jgi:hypothetical protein
VIDHWQVVTSLAAGELGGGLFLLLFSVPFVAAGVFVAAAAAKAWATACPCRPAPPRCPRPFACPYGKSEKGVRLAQKMQVGPCIPVGMQLEKG